MQDRYAVVMYHYYVVAFVVLWIAEAAAAGLAASALLLPLLVQHCWQLQWQCLDEVDGAELAPPQVTRMSLSQMEAVHFAGASASAASAAVVPPLLREGMKGRQSQRAISGRSACFDESVVLQRRHCSRSMYNVKSLCCLSYYPPFQTRAIWLCYVLPVFRWS